MRSFSSGWVNITREVRRVTPRACFQTFRSPQPPLKSRAVSFSRTFTDGERGRGGENQLQLLPLLPLLTLLSPLQQGIKRPYLKKGDRRGFPAITRSWKIDSREAGINNSPVKISPSPLLDTRTAGKLLPSCTRFWMHSPIKFLG